LNFCDRETLPVSQTSMDKAQIGNMGLASLVHEPIRLNNEAERCNEELEALVMQNYRVFVENLTCSVELRVEDQKLTKVSHDLEELLTQLSQKCSTFCDRVNMQVSMHKRNRKTLGHHMQLVELLEVPQLVDACTRNGFYDEALELANFVNGLERRHLLAEGLKMKNHTTAATAYEKQEIDQSILTTSSSSHGGDVIASIISEVHSTLLSLRSQLLIQLSKHASLSKALSILSTLRRVDSLLVDRQLNHIRHNNENINKFNNSTTWSEEDREKLRANMIKSCETRLQMEFLETRTLWLQNSGGADETNISGSDHVMVDSSLSGSDNSPRKIAAAASIGTSAPLSPYAKAIELLETSRSAWFAVVTQYNALFSSNNSSSNNNTADSNSSYTSTGILSSWVSQQVSTLLEELQKLCCEMDEGAALRAVLEQALFFGQRMSQVGCDFNSLLIPMFDTIVVNKIKNDWKMAKTQLIKMLDTERFDVFDSESSHSTAGDVNNDTNKSFRISQQVVPLYIKQVVESESVRNVMTPGGATTGGKKSSTSKDIKAPQFLASYPPLAFWLNSLMKSLNFLRDCPLSSSRDDVATQMHGMMLQISEYLIKISSELRSKGNKYLVSTTSSSNISTTGDNQVSSSTADKLDRMYARAVAQHLLPHALSCYDGIYGLTPAKSVSIADTSETNPSLLTPAKGHDVSKDQSAIHIERLLDAQPLLSKTSFKILQDCWTILRDSGLIADAAFTPSPVPPHKR
jgi:hypothetical protein